MKPVQVISASAGSGKTSRLARHLAEEICEGRVRPEAVVAVTFTVKAAAPLLAPPRAAGYSGASCARSIPRTWPSR